VCQDWHATAVLDIHPINPGHVLVIPNRHVASLADLDPQTAGELFRMAQRVAAALRLSGIDCEGFNLLLADGEAAGQEVFHTHLHVIPRFRGDGVGFKFGPGYPRNVPRSELDAAAKRIRELL
jgi:histidine triad (HIT) family protein